MSFEQISVPAEGERVRYDPETETFSGAEAPIIPFLCDEDGKSVVDAAQRVLDAGADEMGRSIHWLRVFAGEEAREQYGTPLPEDTISALRRFRLALVGPISEPTGQRFHTELRKQLSVDTELQPISHLAWTPSAISTREKVDVVCFRDITEDSAAGLDFEDGSTGASRIRELAEAESEQSSVEHGPAAFGIRPFTRMTTERLVERAIEYALDRDRSRVTIVHQGDQLSATEGAFCQWAMEYLEAEYSDAIVSEERFRADYHTYPDDELVVGQRHTDDVCRELLTRPDEYDVLIAPAMAGDHVAAVGATAVGGPGVTPTALLGDGQILAGPVPHSDDRRDGDSELPNPIGTIRAGCFLFEALGWEDAAGVVRDGIEATLAEGVLTRDLARQTTRSEVVSTAEFVDRVIGHIHAPDETSLSGGVRTTAEERAAIKGMIAGVYNVLFEDQILPADLELNQLRGEDEEADIYLPEVGINFGYWRHWPVERRLEVLIHEFAHVENYDDGHEPSFYDRFVELTEVAEDWQAELEVIFDEPIDFELLTRYIVESVHEETIEPEIESVAERKRALRQAFELPKRGHY